MSLGSRIANSLINLVANLHLVANLLRGGLAAFLRLVLTVKETRQQLELASRVVAFVIRGEEPHRLH